MAVPTLKWRALAPVTLSANTVNAAMDALYTAGTAATYADGSGRVQGTDSAWSWTGNRDTTNTLQAGATTATWAYPPTLGYAPGVGTVIPQVLMWCGSTAAPTTMQQYTYGGTDARTASMLYCGVVKNPGAYNNAVPAVNLGWNGPLPFTSGQFTGGARAFVLPVTATWNRVYMWECPEAVIVAFARTSPQIDTSWSGGGAIGDPGISGLGETDGRIYGVFTSGSNNYNATNMWTNASDAAFFETSVAGQSRFGCFLPGSGTISGYQRFGNFTPATTFVNRSTPSPEIPLIPVYASGLLTASLPAPIRLREIFLAKDGICGQTLSNGGVTLGYVAGVSALTTAFDAAVLTV
jgi:hypothetical protein